MATTQERIDDLAAGLTHRLGLKKELKTVVEVLHDDEDVLLMAAGEYDNKQGLVLATTARVFFYQRGVMGGKQEDFFYNKISSIQNDSGMRFGKLKGLRDADLITEAEYEEQRAAIISAL